MGVFLLAYGIPALIGTLTVVGAFLRERWSFVRMAKALKMSPYRLFAITLLLLGPLWPSVSFDLPGRLLRRRLAKVYR